MAESEAVVEKKLEQDSAEYGNDLVEMVPLDFDMLCATVAMQSRGDSAWKNSFMEGERMETGSLQRMWEGDVLDCFDDRGIAIESACFPCYRFTKNMRKAGFGFSSLQGIIYFALVLASVVNYITFVVTMHHLFLYMGLISTLLVGVLLGYSRGRIRKKFSIRGSGTSVDDFVNHFLCSCCALCQESRTLELNNVQDGTWHGRGNTIHVGSLGEGNKVFYKLHQHPPIQTDMKSAGDNGDHSWIIDTNHSAPLVPST